MAGAAGWLNSHHRGGGLEAGEIEVTGPSGQDSSVAASGWGRGNEVGSGAWSGNGRRPAADDVRSVPKAA